MSSSDYVSCENDRRKRMITGLQMNNPADIRTAVHTAYDLSYNFIVTQITHPSYARDLIQYKAGPTIGRTDRVLQSSEWNRLIVGELTATINLDSEIEHVALKSKEIFQQELTFASHLGLPVVKFSLHKARNPQLGRICNERLLTTLPFTAIWVTLPMIHPSQFSPICDEKEDTWDWWNSFRTFCDFHKNLGLALELPDIAHVPSEAELDRWLGEPVKALIIPSNLFVVNMHDKFVLSKVHQEIIQKFLVLDVQYIIKSDGEGDISTFAKYLNFLGKKLYIYDSIIEYSQGIEDQIQNPLQPLTEHLETNIYEVFEKDQVKYTTYQNAVHRALDDIPKNPDSAVVIMVVGAGRGPLVQAVLNVSYILHRKVKVYAIEKNPFAINTLIDRNENEWGNQVILVKEDMRLFEPTEKADILVSELLGSFGDNELSPECLDGAQRFLKRTGISIPSAYTSYVAPLQSLKIYNEIRHNRAHDKTVTSSLETPYVIKLVNFYQIASPQALFTFHHPNWREHLNNERYKKLRFHCQQNSVLTGFAGFFDTVLYKDVMLSTHPETHTREMISWFPMVFSLPQPVYVKEGEVVELSFWRVDGGDKVWYEWCLESPVRQTICNPGGRSSTYRKN